jgi:hypothetical protein
VKLLGREAGIGQDRFERFELQVAAVNGNYGPPAGDRVPEDQVRSGLAIVDEPDAVQHGDDLAWRNPRELAHVMPQSRAFARPS